MDVYTAIKERRSIRSFKDIDIEEEKLKKVLDAGRLAPSANNRQNWKFILVRDKEKRKRLAKAAKEQAFVGEAPAVLVMCATESSKVMSCGQPAYTIDLSIALSYMVLEAWEQGLGTCWLGAFIEDEVKKILDIPQNVRVVAMSPLGYPNESPEPRPRKKFDEVVCFDSYK